MRNILKIIPFLIAFLLTLFTLSSAAQHRVIRVVDGDTIVVDYKGIYEGGSVIAGMIGKNSKAEKLIICVSILK